MNEIKKMLKNEAIFTSLLYILVGFIFLLFPNLSAKFIAYIVGTFVLVFGVNKILHYQRLEKITYRNRFDLFLGIFSCSAAILIFLNTYIIINIIPYIAGVLMLVEGISLLRASKNIKDDANTIKITYIIIMILICGGILVIINPFAVVKTILMIIGTLFIFNGASQIWALKNVKLLLENKEVD